MRCTQPLRSTPRLEPCEPDAPLIPVLQVLGDNVNTRETTAKAPADAVSDLYDVAKAHFDLKEYLRCAHLLIVRLQVATWARAQCRLPLTACLVFVQKVPGQDSRFLRCYALYLAGEKRKSEEVTELGGSAVRAYQLSWCDCSRSRTAAAGTWRWSAKQGVAAA